MKAARVCDRPRRFRLTVSLFYVTFTICRRPTSGTCPAKGGHLQDQIKSKQIVKLTNQPLAQSRGRELVERFSQAGTGQIVLRVWRLQHGPCPLPEAASRSRAIAMAFGPPRVIQQSRTAFVMDDWRKTSARIRIRQAGKIGHPNLAGHYPGLKDGRIACHLAQSPGVRATSSGASGRFIPMARTGRRS